MCSFFIGLSALFLKANSRLVNLFSLTYVIIILLLSNVYYREKKKVVTTLSYPIPKAISPTTELPDEIA